MAQASIRRTGGSLRQSLFAQKSRECSLSVRGGIGSFLERGHGSSGITGPQLLLPCAERISGRRKSAAYWTSSLGKSIFACREGKSFLMPLVQAHLSATHLREASHYKLMSKFLLWKPEADDNKRFGKLGLVQLLGINAGAYFQSAMPAQAAKFVPPPLGTSDSLPVTDEVTAADLGGLATVGFILLLVFIVGNFLLPSMMFTDGDSASPYKRDEEGDFYHDPSFTKKFFKDARASDEDIDEVAWSKAPFSKLAHGLSKILPPPSSVDTPAELTKARRKVLQSPSGPVGSGVRFSGIVAAPGYGTGGPDRRDGGNQATSSGLSGSLAPSDKEGLSMGQEDVTVVESGSNAHGSAGAVKEPEFANVRQLYRLDTSMTRRSRRGRKRMAGFGRSRSLGGHINS